MELQNYNQIIKNSIENEKIDNEVTQEKQNNFLETTLGGTINTAINLGLRYILPNLIEDQIIEIKDTIIKDGFKDGMDKAIESILDLGKSASGIITGKFDNVSQIQTAVEKGGLIDTVSNAIDFGLKVANKTGIIPKGVVSVIKSGKNVIIDNIESNIENTLMQQLRGVEKIDRYTKNWNKYYKEQNFEKMEQEYYKIKEQLNNLVPLEETIKKAHQVENLHKLIRNKGKDFNLTQEEIDLAKKLM